jgi:hypothetical protein
MRLILALLIILAASTAHACPYCGMPMPQIQSQPGAVIQWQPVQVPGQWVTQWTPRRVPTLRGFLGGPRAYRMVPRMHFVPQQQQQQAPQQGQR